MKNFLLTRNLETNRIDISSVKEALGGNYVRTTVDGDLYLGLRQDFPGTAINEYAPRAAEAIAQSTFEFS